MTSEHLDSLSSTSSLIGMILILIRLANVVTKIINEYNGINVNLINEFSSVIMILTAMYLLYHIIYPSHVHKYITRIRNERMIDRFGTCCHTHYYYLMNTLLLPIIVYRCYHSVNIYTELAFTLIWFVTFTNNFQCSTYVE